MHARGRRRRPQGRGDLGLGESGCRFMDYAFGVRRQHKAPGTVTPRDTRWSRGRMVSQPLHEEDKLAGHLSGWLVGVNRVHVLFRAPVQLGIRIVELRKVLRRSRSFLGSAASPDALEQGTDAAL